MQQHPIPQNVTQYQFRLVGDMTLKQFLELASGLLLAYLFFASNLLFLFKWPLVIASILFGVALAFFPLEDRPLDQWIINFIHAIYGPTRFIWKKSDKIPSMFTFSPHPIAATTTVTKTIKAPSAPTKEESISDLSEVEAAKVNLLDTIFTSLPATETPVAPPPQAIVKPSVTIRKLGHQDGSSTKTTIFSRPIVPIDVPKAESIVVEKPQTPAPPKADTAVFTKPSVATAPTAPKVTTTPLKTISLPSAPRAPNLVVGVVVDKDGKLLENSIVELISADGIPQRAMKTNALGQFYTATPLGNGTYTVEVESDGHIFSTQQLKIEDKIIPPFELRATS